MRLLELRLENFRQFEGLHTLKIAPDGDRNVTVVYGANGSGKTTLLNAFTWCLYGKLTQDFMYPNRLISDGLWADLQLNHTAEAAVTLEFEHNGEHFTLDRRARATKIAEDADQRPVEEGTLVRRTAQGAMELQNPKDFIDTILPDRLHHFFFLNGERFDHLLSASAFDDIEGAIKTILGIEIIERGIDHLKDVEKRLNSAYRRLGSVQEAEILERLDDANDRKDRYQRALKENEADQRRQNDEIAKLDQRLRELDGSKRLQQERDDLDARFRSTRALREASLVRRLDLLGAKGFLAFVPTAAQRAVEKYEDMREKREIPRGIKLTFVEDLLTHGTCVCGTDVSTAGPARTQLESWKAKSGRPELEESWMQFGTRLGDWVAVHLPDLQRQLADYDSQMARFDADINSMDQRLSELSRELGAAEEEDIRELEGARREARAELDRLMKKGWQQESSLKAAVNEVQQAEAALRQAKAASTEAEIAQRRILAAEDVRRALELMRELRTKDVRNDLDGRIKSVYSAVVKKRQIPALSDAFQLLLQENVDGQLMPKAMSTGEAQVLTLSFVGGLADLARSTYEESRSASVNPLVSAAGGIFPFVADAIFGTLDENFRKEVTRLLPSLAPQVVLFLSKAQSAGEVRAQLEPRVGAVAVIDAQMARTDVQPEKLSYDGQEYPYVSVQGGDADRSSLVTIKEPESANE